MENDVESLIPIELPVSQETKTIDLTNKLPKKKKNKFIPDMNETLYLTVNKCVTEYELKRSKSLISSTPLYNTIFGTLPRGEKRDLCVIDKDRLEQAVPGETIRISAKSIGTKERKKYDFTAWANTSMELFKLIPVTSPISFFKECPDWEKSLNLLFYQGLTKDIKLVKCMKSWMVPIPPQQCFQRYNNHGFCFTQTQTGKTQLAHEITGRMPVRNPSWPGLAGSSEREGLLKGDGMIFLDECNLVRVDEEQTPLIGQLLDYMVQGGVFRGVNKGVATEGTRTIIFMGNPPLNSEPLMAYNINHIFKSLGSLDAAGRVGSRIGIFLMDISLEPVKGKPIGNSDNYFALRTLIKESLVVRRRELRKLFQLNERWFCDPDDDYKKKRKEVNIVSLPLADFADGLILGNGTMRTKCAALKLTLLENLDKFMLMPLEQYMSETSDALMVNYDFFKSINIECIRKMSNLPESATFSFFKSLVEDDRKVLGLSNRMLESMFNKDASTIALWKDKIMHPLKYVDKSIDWDD